MKRDSGLDLVRAIAIICVVLNHAIEQVYPVLESSILEYSLKGQIFCFTGWIIGRSFGVPLFFYLTGYLLLSKEYENKNDIMRFYKRNFLPLLGAWEVWILIYQVYFCFRDNTAFNIPNYLKDVLFLKHVDLPHTWYIPVILGVYLFLPFISVCLRQMSEKFLLVIVLVVYLYCLLFPSISLIFTSDGQDPLFTTQLFLGYSGGLYGLYLLIGYLCNRYKEQINQYYNDKIKKNLIVLGAICSFVCTVYIQLHLRSMGNPYTVAYDFFLIPISSTVAFVLLSRIKLKDRYKGIVTQMSLCAFGVYCIHEPVIQILDSAIKSSHASIKAIILAVLAVVISFILSELLSCLMCGKKLILRKN